MGLWILTVLEAVGMGAAGAVKFSGDTWLRMFEAWGYPAAFSYVIGVVEVGGALLVLVPKVAAYAATLLLTVMLGALITLMVSGDPTEMGLTTPLVHMALLSVILRARWSRRWRPT